MSDSKMTGMLTCPDCKVIHPLGGCAEYLREKRLASAMTDTLRDRLGALVRELTARLEEAESECNLNETEHDWPAMNHNRGEIEAYKVALRLAAQPAPAVMGEDAARKRLLYEPLGDFSFSQHVAAKLSTLLSEKYTNSQKIVAGIIKQEIEAVFREVDAEGRTAAAESREEPVSKKKCSVCNGERTQLNREGTQFGACKSARCEFPLLDYDNEQREFAARQPGESPT